VSAVSAPKPEEAAEPASDADGWALLEGLRRRIDDQAALGRKTQAQVSQLAESIAGLVAQQRRRSLWLNVNSFVAYLMFTILCAAGCYLLYLSRARELTAAREQATGERDAAVRRADDATVRAVAREAAETKAWAVYQLLEAGKRSEAVAKLDALRDQPLSKTERAVLAARVHDTQVMEVDAALKAAVASFKAGRPADVIKPLEAALTGEPPGARAATIHYYLGVAYARTELDKATAHLQAAIAGDVDQDDVRFQLASVLDRSGAYPVARAEYDRFATAHPQSQLAVFAMRRSATLARLPAVAPVAGQLPAAPGPAALRPGVPLPPGAGGPSTLGASGLAPSGAGGPAAPGAGGPAAPGASGPAAPGAGGPAAPGAGGPAAPGAGGPAAPGAGGPAAPGAGASPRGSGGAVIPGSPGRAAPPPAAGPARPPGVAAPAGGVARPPAVQPWAKPAAPPRPFVPPKAAAKPLPPTTDGVDTTRPAAPPTAAPPASAGDPPAAGQ
jgi:tetratricopeptide (TPR) repeat protein